MMSDDRHHWQHVYLSKSSTEMSWYQPKPAASLDALDRNGATPADSLIDVGGGASTLVDALIERGWDDLAVLDISEAALDASRKRLGNQAQKVRWIADDIRDWLPDRRWSVWHDRAVFHFLVNANDRERYKQRLLEGLSPSGIVIMATFAPDGPERCSGLPVQRYDAPALQAELGSNFELVEAWSEKHSTPWSSSQAFCWTAFRTVR
ncbi:class I SAM-dependent methyltransferase [Sphingomonas sp. KRR8]|uniref:class I SAM-dependent methyltransferase n=1 Tax=Sphingomonas sp. KRR8 TaxID=2942996 RepID=UPI00201FC1A8|nr:class I SAM-dependent methyltransferase [Sphingomonas sp. KRR8]URD61120.1 class I SAM-dependent methyltransferase [Sphingomonas sp. KRR8]